jgi:energy-coupling factor transporter ATP-binding protein EcfA2
MSNLEKKDIMILIMDPEKKVATPVANLSGKVFIEIHPPKELENSPESFARLLLAVSHLKGQSLIDRLTGKETENVTFEIAVFNSTIHFYTIVPHRMHTYIDSQILAAYPQAKTTKLETDYLNAPSLANAIFKELALTDAFYFPLRTFQDDKNTDPLSAVLGALSKTPATDIVVFQLNLAHGGSWQGTGRSVIQRGVPDAPGPDGKMRYKSHPHAKLIESKISQKGFDVGMRLLSFSPNQQTAQNNLENIASSFGSFALGEGNNIRIRKDSVIFKSDHKSAFFKRTIDPHPSHQYLNVNEIATLFHLPDDTTGLIKNIAWGGENFTEPPENLPVSTPEMTDEEKKGINFFGKTTYKNLPATFGVKDGEDRRRHFYIIGKTGTGKSTLIANMAISDIRKGHGVAVIDPHGDLSEMLLNYIPSERINDVAYLDPSSSERSFRLNPFEVNDLDQADIIASGIVSIFQKLYSYSWGPRLEYILRNAVLTLVKKKQLHVARRPQVADRQNFPPGCRQHAPRSRPEKLLDKRVRYVFRNLSPGGHFANSKQGWTIFVLKQNQERRRL